MAETKDLSMIMDANIPIIVIESPDERRVLALLLRLAMKKNLSFYEWSSTRGLRRGGMTNDSVFGDKLSEPVDLLQHMASDRGPGLYALCDFHPFIKNEPLNLRYLKDIALDYDRLKNTVVLISHRLEVPADIGRLTAKFDLRLPSDEELMAIVRDLAREWSLKNRGNRVKTDDATLKKLIANLRGVSHADAQVLVRHAIFGDGAITDSDIPDVNKLKFELLDSEGVLRFEYDTEQFTNVAGLNNLKRWLELRREAFIQSNGGTKGGDRPKGVMLLGVQGGGKSLAAKSIAGYWGVPLLRLDFGSLYNKFYGETERNLRNSLRQAEMMSPCVLWMDEIEKGIATGETDNATSQRVLGTLLTWMAENERAVFIVATSNDIAALPPELVRKGRLDEVFFVDLPDAEVRAEIFRIHLSKRGIDTTEFDTSELAAATEGFTGAEIEEAVVSARYLASSDATELSQANVLSAVNRTYPMSVLRAESINQLRHWATDRTVPA